MEKERIDFIDIYRGFGILFMIMGHVYFGSIFNKWIHAFHMPMFYFVTGYFYNSKLGILDFTKKKARSLLVPYFVFCIICSLLFCAINGKLYWLEMLDIIWINNKGWIPIGPMWYLTSLFIALIIFKLIDYVPNKYIKGAICAMISIFGCMVSTTIVFTLPWSMMAAFVSVVFLYVGSLVKQKKIDEFILNRMTQVKMFILLISLFILIFINGEINMREGIYAFIPLFYINAFLAICFFGCLSKWIWGSLINRFRLSISSIKYIGENSIVFLCFNQILIFIFNNYVNININMLLYKIIELFMVLICCFILSVTINRTPLKWIINK